MISARSHVEEIAHVALGKGSLRDAPVVQSWLRCLNDYRLDPAQAQEAYIVPATQLKEHREQSDELIRIGRSAVEGLFRHVMDQHYVLLLSDARGVTVDFMGDPTFDNQLRRAGLYLGSEWSENRAGTCAVGACIVSGDPVIIHQDDHFDSSHIGLTCTAAPIFDTLGDLTAVLDISQLRSPTVKASQHLALHLVTTTARRIELANLMARTRHDWILRISRSPDFLDVDPEAAIAIDANGRISGLTHGGFRALARMFEPQPGAARGVIGTPISQLFDIDVDDLPRFTRSRADRERVIRTRSGVMLFAGAIAPVTRTRGLPAADRIPRPLRELSFGDAAMEAVQLRASKLAPRDVPILIQGETGAGKEFLARAIHDIRPNPGRFVAVNCAAIPEALIESELFGYASGAFTGAAPRGKIGLIEAADGGTLFLDEIGDMPIGLQARLLRVLSEGEITPVGAHRPKPVSFRLISASHHRLDQLVADGRFRRDLFFRLNAATLMLPALRERQDLDGLVDHLLARIGADEGRAIRLSHTARMALRRHPWPGNLRELANTLRVAAALADGSEITPDDLPETLRNPAEPAAPASSASDDLAAELAACGGNVSELARRLGVDRSTIHRRLRRLKRS
ncbi:sigma-54-dependent Fis family transcriptional regulator [Bradyrhizobium acaciae]|uniref:sigma-54-dependent Fis family transcriptional regulator n=1 Tax=Bradyrhizobium acaciae TaxID=2683706 RepID=UPI001E2E2227|nr:sigma-54-dependent Fis family transcriptional regulator [Bradyrhizobium acaciae]MCC8981987.1 sigma-54-dependent Fis family transcriptional regulator [Bradyrhizobium acaciae]